MPPARTGRIAAALLAAATLAGCGAGSSASTTTTVPDVIGQTLDAAKSTLLTAGFVGDSQDLLRGRNQLLDSAWTVCTQTPGPVPAAAGTTVDLGVVKKAETCPGRKTTAPTPTTSRKPRPTAKPKAVPTSEDNDARTATEGSSCEVPDTGVSPKGKPMVCTADADGHSRWRSGG
jgi:beta-lactam-binding protein with PASTA domain